MDKGTKIIVMITRNRHVEEKNLTSKDKFFYKNFYKNNRSNRLKLSNI